MKVLQRLKPEKLFLAADGPRAQVSEDAHNCAETRRIVEEMINWECEVFKNYSETNLGCGFRPASGISWVFESVDRCIILEDDCIPHLDFFRFCDELLEKYRDDERVAMIGGTNLHVAPIGNDSYYFSYFNQIWGWATWKRAWEHFDLKTEDWNTRRESGWMDELLNDQSYVKHYRSLYDRHFYREDIWDYMWQYACWKQDALCLLPRKNLISNIGFNASATHTDNEDHFFANAKTRSLKFPLIHPQSIQIESNTESALFAAMNPKSPIWKPRLRRLLKKIGFN